MRRAISSLLGRERRREVYAQLVAASGVGVAPRAAWLLLRLGEHRGDSRAALARRLYIGVPELSSRMTELVRAGYVEPAEPAPDGADELTESGTAAYARIFAARQDMIEQKLEGWQPELHPRLLELLSEITHELAAGSERPDPDLDLVR